MGRPTQARRVVCDDPVEAADRNTLARPILTNTDSLADARATDHHLGRWPRYFRRASQCHVANQGRAARPVHPVDYFRGDST